MQSTQLTTLTIWRFDAVGAVCLVMKNRKEECSLSLLLSSSSFFFLFNQSIKQAIICSMDDGDRVTKHRLVERAQAAGNKRSPRHVRGRCIAGDKPSKARVLRTAALARAIVSIRRAAIVQAERTPDGGLGRVRARGRRVVDGDDALKAVVAACGRHGHCTAPQHGQTKTLVVEEARIAAWSGIGRSGSNGNKG